MIHSTFNLKSVKFLRWGFPIAIALCVAAASPTFACKAAPGSRPAAIEQRLEGAPYVFEGTVDRVEGETLTIRVNRYLKGQGPQIVRLTGFNQTSCQDIISETGGRYLFFGERNSKNTWTAVYDGAFGSSRPWSSELETELQGLGLLEKPNNPPEARRLPPNIASAVKQDAARRSRLPLSRIQIVSSEFRISPDFCMGIAVPARTCTDVEGWLVTVRAGDRILVYQTDDRGNAIQVEESQQSGGLPPAIADTVKRQIAQLFNLPLEKLQIVSSERQTWPDGCLGLNFPDRTCTEALVEGWRVTARAGRQQFIYRTDGSGETVELENGASVLPNPVRNAVLVAAARQTGLPRNQLRLTNAFPRIWDGCLGIYEEPGQVCTKIAIFGWQVSVEGQNNRLVYHTNQNGSDTRLNPAASSIASNNSALNPVAIPQGELPPPLPAKAVFRAISGGGITGDVQEVTLWQDGKLSLQSTRGENRTRWVSLPQVRELEQTLQQQRFGQYDRLAFPPPPGAADMIGVMLTARQGTMRYADYETEKLPASLRAVLAAWQKVLDSARDEPMGSNPPLKDNDVAIANPNETYPWSIEQFLFQWLKPLF